ncbi:unnamed protein product [Zymoseptoria tritici ST99CH_1A5]|uniref:Uncharacterized protein n=2 Tax=Zymoseptoria tritici TaxID=1047171 RepID=A0A1X7RNF0_ZYMT9|nr:unnamed protein product [Zymoseptoria tritici ST99CH_3D7]SMR49930.1 unnamed protein product [Zymoseptoria tritici ST99CH_3D1]SMY22632.1 unnamed protein product [Zymoseptoria tritici ST99CH_1A5]
MDNRPSVRGVLQRIDRIIDQDDWRHDDEDVIISARGHGSLVAVILDSRPELRPNDSTKQQQVSANVRRLRELVWTESLLATNPVGYGEQREGKLPGWFQRQWRLLISWIGVTDSTSEAYLLASNKWAELDDFGDRRTGVKLIAVDAALLVRQNPSPIERLRRDIAGPLAIVHMQRTIDAMRIESKKQLHEDFKLKLADLLATLEHSQVTIQQSFASGSPLATALSGRGTQDSSLESAELPGSARSSITNLDDTIIQPRHERHLKRAAAGGGKARAKKIRLDQSSSHDAPVAEE